MSILETRLLSKHYTDGDNIIKAVDNVTISIDKGESLAITGVSGCGKTTLLNLLGGIDKPTSGKVFVDNTDLSTLSETQRTIFRRRRIGFVFQSYNLIPVLNAWENIVLPIELDGRLVDKEYIKDLMDTLKIYDRKNHLPSALSGGQQQRVAIARALASNPAIVLADEPTGNLDSENGEEVLQLLKTSLQKYSSTLALITHDHDICNMANRVIKLKDGQIVD